MRRGNFYSRLVAWLKILLPLVALGILSSVVFFARDAEDHRTIPFVTQDSGAETPDERLTKPEYVGLTTDGSMVSLRADHVTPVGGDPQVLDARSLDGRIETDGGRTVTAKGVRARIDLTANVTRFSGEVQFETSDGYDLLTPDLSTRLDVTRAESPGPIRGTAPYGTLDAGSMVYSVRESGQSLLVLSGGVKLIYEPRKRRGSE